MVGSSPEVGIRAARELFPATEHAAYFNTASVGLASEAVAAAYHLEPLPLAHAR